MDYEKLSEQSLDEIMNAIRAENGKTFPARAAQASPAPNAPCAPASGACLSPAPSLEDVDVCIETASVGPQIGLRRSPMRCKRGLIRRIAQLVEKLYLRVAELTNRDLRDFAGAVLSFLRISRQRLEQLFWNDTLLDARLQEDEKRLADTERRLLETEKRLSDAENALSETNRLLRALSEELRGRASSHEALLSGLETRLGGLETRFVGMEPRLGGLETRFDGLEPRFSGLETRLGADEARMFLPGNVSLPGGDSFYHDFEERFRGSEEEILHRLEIYLPFLSGHFGSFIGRNCIDLGCGRGEMLDLLRFQGTEYRTGVDTDPAQLAIASKKGHKTVCQDCVAYLREQSSESADLISAIQLAEHLNLPALCALLEESFRVLKHGGVLLLETPNAGNLISSATWFGIDPTHMRPLHPELLRFLAERCGFAELQIMEVNPAHEGFRLKPISSAGAEQPLADENFDRLSTLLYGAQDYALIGVKA